MKKLFTLLLVLVSWYCHAQRITTLVLQDANGWRDTVYFGQHPGATPGIDAALGEVEMSNIPMLGTEMRFVSRAPLSCFIDSMLFYRNHSYESKKDLRGTLVGGPIWMYGSQNFGLTNSEMADNTFHLKVKCTALPCTLTALNQGPFVNQLTDFLVVYSVAGSTWETNCSSLRSVVSNNFLDYSFMPGRLDIIRSHLPNVDTLFYYYFYYVKGPTSLPRSLSLLNLKVSNQTLEAGNTNPLCG